MTTPKRKPVPAERIVKYLRSGARELAKPFENWDEDFETDGVAGTMREAATRLLALEKKCLRLEAKLVALKVKK